MQENHAVTLRWLIPILFLVILFVHRRLSDGWMIRDVTNEPWPPVLS